VKVKTGIYLGKYLAGIYLGVFMFSLPGSIWEQQRSRWNANGSSRRGRQMQVDEIVAIFDQYFAISQKPYEIRTQH